MARSGFWKKMLKTSLTLILRSTKGEFLCPFRLWLLKITLR